MLWSGKEPEARELILRVGKDCLFMLDGPNLRVSTVREGKETTLKTLGFISSVSHSGFPPEF